MVDIKNLGLKVRMGIAGTAIAVFYLILVTFLKGIVGAFIGGTVGDLGSLVVTVGLTILVMFGQYVLSKRLIVERLEAEELSAAEYPEVRERFEELVAEMEIEEPRLLIAELGTPNAFALGRRSDGIVVLSEEIVQLLGPDELEGIIAHELSHLQNRDSIIQGMAVSIVMMIQTVTFYFVLFWSRVGLALRRGLMRRKGYDYADPSAMRAKVRRRSMLFALLITRFVQLFTRSLSRHREYIADETAVEATENPAAMRRALQKVDRHASEDSEVEGVPSSLCIHGSFDGMLQRAFSTHPGIEKRTSRLESKFESES